MALLRALKLAQTRRRLVLVILTGYGLHLVPLEVRIKPLPRDFACLLLCLVSHFRLLNFLLVSVKFLVCGVHIDVAFNLWDCHTFTIPSTGDNVIEAENEIDGLAVDRTFVHALRLALVHDNLLHLPDDLDVLDNV